jgi:hypothetical protein
MARRKRYYSLFYKNEKGKYVRISTLRCWKEDAVRLWQDHLLEGSFRGCAMYLRPVEPELKDGERETILAAHDEWRKRVFGK